MSKSIVLCGPQGSGKTNLTKDFIDLFNKEKVYHITNRDKEFSELPQADLVVADGIFTTADQIRVFDAGIRHRYEKVNANITVLYCLQDTVKFPVSHFYTIPL